MFNSIFRPEAACDSLPFGGRFSSHARRSRPTIAGAAARASRWAVLCLAAFSVVSAAAQSDPANSAKTSTMPPVVVSATRFPEVAASLPFGVSVLTAEDLAESGVSTVNEALMKLLGIQGRADFYGGGDYSLDLRGFGSTAGNNQVVIVDGIRINEADLGGTRLAGIAIDTVERIEVLRGSGTVLYGEGATGGVIVITTKAGARGTHAQAYAALGTDRLRDLRGTASLSAGDFSLDVAANRRTADNHRDNFHSEVEGAALTGQWRHDGFKLGVRYAYDDLDTGLPGSLTAAQYAANPRQTNTPNNRGAIRNERRGVFAEADLGAWQLGFDAGWRDKSLTSVSPSFTYAYEVEAKNYALRARHKAPLAGGANSLVFGLDRGEWERTVLGSFGSLAEQSSTGFYAKDDFTLAGGTRLSVGVRTEQIEKSVSTVTDRIDQRERAWEVGVLQPLGAGVSVYGRLGRSFRLANVDEFSFTTPGLSLVPQTSRDAELGLRWVTATGSADLRVYRSALEHEIGYDPNGIGPFGPGANVNFDATRRQGAELELMHALTRDLSLRANAAVRQARFSAGPYEGKNVPLTSKQTLALRADWVPAAGHQFDAGLSFVSSQSPDFANACSIPSHTTADARYAYRWLSAEFALAVANLTDRKYYTQAFRCAAGQTTSIYPEAGRAFTASVRVGF